MADVLSEAEARDEVFDDDRQDNDSGIQKDEKDNEVNEEEKKEPTEKKKKQKIKIRSQSPQKLQQRNKDGSPKKVPFGAASPPKSPKKRKKRIPQDKLNKTKNSQASVVKNESFDPERSAVK
jgi:hypothetical protein